jgi:hypothetical protein
MFSQESYAQTATNKQVATKAATKNIGTVKRQKINVKCHVELLGGKNTLHFAVIKADKFSQYSKKIVGMKIPTAQSKKKVAIYQVVECVNLEQNFTSLASKQLDLDTAR